MKKPDIEKTIDELKKQYQDLQKQLTDEAAERKKAEKQREELLNNVGLQVKSLNCLYGLSELIGKFNDSLDDIFSGIVYLIPPSWQHPDVTAARIIFKEKEFKTADFKITEWMQSADIKLFDSKAGVIEVCLLEERPPADEGPFLVEEKRLIHDVAKRLGRAAERKQMQEELVQARKTAEDNYNKLRELEDLKNSLIHMIVHDLNNPLSIVSGNLELLGMKTQEKLTEEEGRYLEVSFLATQELRTMISDLLDINKMEEGKLILRYEEFILGDVAKETADRMGVVARRDKKILSSSVSEGMPKILADKDLIKRVITNLTNNALKFTPPEGSVTIKARYDEPEKAFMVRVEDTGSGIPKEFLGKIFDKFVQVETKQAKKGRGLGLAFCKMTVEAHGGKIWVESEVDKGSQFIFTLPVGCKKS